MANVLVEGWHLEELLLNMNTSSVGPRPEISVWRELARHAGKENESAKIYDARIGFPFATELVR